MMKYQRRRDWVEEESAEKRKLDEELDASLSAVWSISLNSSG